MRAVVAVATLAMTVSYIDRQTMAALGPTVKRALSLDNAEWGDLTSAFSIAYLACAPLAGMLVDRAGARRGLALAVIVWSAVAGLHAAAPAFAALFVLRILLGVAESPTYPAAARCVGAVAPVRSRSAALAWLFTGSSVGAAVAGPAAIWLLQRTGSFRFAFAGIALLGLAYVPLFWKVTGHASVEPLVEKREAGSGAGSMTRLFALLREPAVLRTCVLVVTSAPAIMLVLNWGPQLLESQLGVPQLEQAKYVWAPPLAFDAGAVAFGALASRRDRIGGRWTDLVFLAALLEGTLAFVAGTRNPVIGILLCSTSMAGGGGLYALAAADLFRQIGLARAGASGGLAAAAQSLAYIVAAPIVGKVLDRTHTYHDVLVTLGAIAIPGALAWSAWPSKPREPRSSQL